MKKNLFFAACILTLVSCSSEKSPEEWNEVYIEKANQFIESKMKDDKSTGSGKIESFTINKVDSSRFISAFEMEQLKMTKLRREFAGQVDYTMKLKDIDLAYLDEMSEGTIIELDKCHVLQDSLDRWESRANKLSKKSTKIKVVYVSTNFVNSDGTVDKNISFPMYFDKDGDLDSQLMKATFN